MVKMCDASIVLCQENETCGPHQREERERGRGRGEKERRVRERKRSELYNEMNVKNMFFNFFFILY